MSVYLTQRNTLADTDIAVSPLGIGTVKLGRNTGVKYPSNFHIPTDQQALALLDQAWDLGINLLDTAPAYGNSEQRLGELLCRNPKDWVVATKVGETFNPDNGKSYYNFTPEFITTSIQHSLKNLRRDYLDIVLIHSDGNDQEIIQHDGALETLAELKQQGLIRAIGMSTKTVEGGLLAVEQSDVVMVMHNLNYQNEQRVIDHALVNNTAVFIKKALASGHLTSMDSSSDIVQTNFDFIFSHPAISSIIIGTINPVHLTDNVAKAAKALTAKLMV